MRLTNADRDAFINAVLDDVPMVDYDTQAQKLVVAAIDAATPTLIKKAFKTHPEFFSSSGVNFRRSGSNLDQFSYGENLLGYTGWETRVAPEALTQILELDKKKGQQSLARMELRSKIRAAIYGCSTLKQALEIMPEFEKYMPRDRDGKLTRQMPVVANLVADLSAAGWPKDKK